MRKQYIIADGLWLILGIAVSIESWSLKIGTFHSPGPGFLPFWAGLFLALFSCVSLIQTAWAKDIPEEISIWTDVNIPKLVLVVLGLLLYVYFLNILGFFVSTLLLLIFLFRIIEPYPWYIVLLASALSLIPVYLVFEHFMDVRLPTGTLIPWP